MSRIQGDLSNRKRIFISIEELLDLLVKTEGVSHLEAASWLLQSGILKKTKHLILLNDYLIYEWNKNITNVSPVQVLEDFAIKGKTLDRMDNLGFARKRILSEINNRGVHLKKELLISAIPFVSSNDSVSDENLNFYKNQCLDLIQNNIFLKKENLTKDTASNKVVVPYIHAIDKHHYTHAPLMVLAAKMHNDIVINQKYKTRSNMSQKVKDWLADNESFTKENFDGEVSDYWVKKMAEIIVPTKKSKLQEFLKQQVFD